MTSQMLNQNKCLSGQRPYASLDKQSKQGKSYKSYLMMKLESQWVGSHRLSVLRVQKEVEAFCLLRIFTCTPVLPLYYYENITFVLLKVVTNKRTLQERTKDNRLQRTG